MKLDGLWTEGGREEGKGEQEDEASRNQRNNYL